MKKKLNKAQVQIISFMLFILLVTGLIMIIWNIIKLSVSQSGGEASEQSSCYTINLEIIEAVESYCNDKVSTNPIDCGVIDWNKGLIKIRRNPGKGDLTGIRVVIEGVSQDIVGINELEIATLNPEILNRNSEIKIAAILSDKRVCPVAITERVSPAY